MLGINRPAGYAAIGSTPRVTPVPRVVKSRHVENLGSLGAGAASTKMRCCGLYRDVGDGRYTHCTLVLCGGTEISGAISNDALAVLEARLVDGAPPPMAA